MVPLILFFLSYLVLLASSQENTTLTFSNLCSYSENSNLDEASWKQNKDKILTILTKEGSIIEKLRFYQITVHEAGLELLFKENITNVKTIHFDGVVFTPSLARFLFEHDLFYDQFEEVILNNCNLQDEDFMNIKEKNSKIKHLNLSNNRISSEGFKHLSKMGMSLETLNLKSNSLVSDDAVDSILDFGFKNLITLNLEVTSISSKGLLSLLKSLNLTKLEILKIGSNHFELGFYEEFSKMEFTSLKILDLENLEIDEDGFTFLSQMYFPNLIELNIDQNQLTPDIAPLVINKKVFPSLEILFFEENFVQQEFLTHLKEQDFNFSIIHFNIYKLNKNFPQLLTDFNFTHLSNLLLSNLILNSTALKEFLKAQPFENLQILQFKESREKEDYIDVIFSRVWPKLKFLIVDEIANLSSRYYEGPVIFPELEELIIEMDHPGQIVTLVENIHKIAPKLHILQISGSTELLISRIINANIINTSNVTLALNIISSGKYPNRFNLIVYPKSENKKPVVKEINVPSVLGIMSLMFFEDFDLEDFINNLDLSILSKGLDINEMIQEVLYEKMEKFLVKMFENFNYEEIEFLYDTENFDMIRMLVKSKDRRWDFNRLKHLHLTLMSRSETNLLKYCYFPMLKLLFLSSVETEESEFGGEFEYSLEFGYGKFMNIEKLVLDLKPKPNHLEQFFKTNGMPYLTEIKLMNMDDLNSQKFKEIQKSIINFKRLIAIDFSSTYINKDLSFLTESGVKLSVLVLKEILFTNGTFKELCSLNYEFMTSMSFESSGIDDRNMVEFVNCLSLKRKPNQHVFPKLELIDLEKNYIGTEGFSKLINLGMPLLALPLFDDNMDFEVFNSIFSSPSSSRIKAFESTVNKFYGIDGTINPRNLRRVELLQIRSAYLRETDIEALSKFDFFDLRGIIILVSRVEDCTFYKYFLELTTNVLDIGLGISESPNLKSTCIPPDYEKSNITFVNFQFMGNEIYGESRNFINNFFQPISDFRNIAMMNAQPNNTKLADMLKTTDFSSVQLFALSSCEITDEFTDQFWKKDLKGLAMLDLEMNLLTSKGFKSMQGLTFENLQLLQLSGNSIGDEGIKFLASNNFPSLKALKLNNVDITEKGLISLSQLNAPNLVQLDISNNDLSFTNLTKLSLSKLKSVTHIIIYPTMKKTEIQQLQQALMKSKKGVLGIVAGEMHIVTTEIDLFENSLNEEFYYDEDDEEKK